MEEYLLTHGMLNQVETGILSLLGNELSPRGRQNLAEILTVHESYLAAALSAIHERYASVDTWLEQEYQLTPDAREALRSRFLEG
jgi:protein tyrosine/serine phosphatase